MVVTPFVHVEPDGVRVTAIHFTRNRMVVDGRDCVLDQDEATRLRDAINDWLNRDVPSHD